MKFYTFDGVITFPDEAPSIHSIAVQLSRECRYAGASLYWWPVALHSFIVADLLPDHLKIHGLLHDAAEVVTGDIPKPAKTPQAEVLEQSVLEAIYRSEGLDLPTKEQAKLVKEADLRTLHGEIWTVGTESLRAIYPHDEEVEESVWHYFKLYKPNDCILATGTCPDHFLHRYREYRQRWLSVKEA